jgi:hypothetical protein
METLQELYNKDIQEERFALLVAARVNEIKSGTAKALEFEQAGGVFYTLEQEHLLFADKIARAVCAHLETGDK